MRVAQVNQDLHPILVEGRLPSRMLLNVFFFGIVASRALILLALDSAAHLGLESLALCLQRGLALICLFLTCLGEVFLTAALAHHPRTVAAKQLLAALVVAVRLALLVAVLARVDELVVDAVVQLRIVVDFVLAVLVPASCRELKNVALVLHLRHFHYGAEESGQVGHRAVEGREDHRLRGGIAQGLVHRVQVELGEAVPRLVVANPFVPVETRRIIVSVFGSNYFLFFGKQDLAARKHRHVRVLKPRVSKGLFDGVSRVRVWVQQALNEVLGLRSDLVFQVVARLHDLLVQVLHVICFERHRSVQHREQNDSRAPQISFEAPVAFVSNDLGRDVGGRTALLVHGFVFLDGLADAEVSNLDVALTVEQDVVEFDVSVEDSLRVDVANTLDDLFEEDLRSEFVQLFAFTHKVKHVATSAKLHHQHDVSASFESLVQLYDAGMAELQKNADLVHDLGSLFLF